MRDDELMTFRVYLPNRGNAVSIDRDGELNIRLSAPGADRDAVLAFLDGLGAGKDDVMRRVVIVDDRPDHARP